MPELTRNRAILILVCGVLALAGGLVSFISTQQWWMAILIAVGVFLIIRGILGIRATGPSSGGPSSGGSPTES